MPFQKIQPEKLSSAVVHQIEQLILRGVLRPGERLPSEREMSEKLGVSRPSLRDAIADLDKRGLLRSKAGSGIYVTENFGSAFSDALVALFNRHEEAAFDYIDFRTDIEGMAAERAAKLASDSDLKVIDAIFRKMEVAHAKGDPDQETQLDAAFHMAIVESSHNVIMLHMMRSMYQLLRQGVFYNRKIVFRQEATCQALLDQHRALNDALQSKNPKAARHAVETHLQFVRRALSEEQKRDANEAIAKLKYGRELTR